MLEIVALKEWNLPPEIYPNTEAARQSLRRRRFLILDEELNADESEILGPSSRVQIEFKRFWDDEYHYEREKDLDFKQQENFSGIISTIRTTRASIHRIAVHISGHVVFGGLFENTPEEGHRFNWATVVPNPPLRNWSPYLGQCDDKFAGEPLDCYVNNKNEAIALAAYSLSGQAAEERLLEAGQLSRCDERNFEIIRDKYGLNREHCFGLAKGFVAEHKTVLDRVVANLEQKLVLSDQQITDLLVG